MTVTYVATSIADASGIDPVQCYTVTTAGQIAPYAREGVGLDYINTSGGFDVPDLAFNFPLMTEGWISFYMYSGDVTDNNWGHYMWCLRNFVNNSGALVAGLYKNMNSLSYRMYRATGGTASTYVTQTGISAALQRWDIRFKVGLTKGELAVYIDGTLVYSVTGVPFYAGSTANGIDSITFQREGGAGTIDRVISGLIVSTEDTRSMVIAMDYPSGAGAHSEWAGGYADLDGIGTNAATSAYATATGQRLSVAFPALNTGLAAMTPVAVAVKASGPASQRGIAGTARVSGTDYTIGAISTPGVKPALGCAVQTLNPATGLAWTQTEINAAEFGLQSIE